MDVFHVVCSNCKKQYEFDPKTDQHLSAICCKKDTPIKRYSICPYCGTENIVEEASENVDEESLNSKTILGQPVSDDDLEWINYGRKLRQNTPSILDENAKSLIAIDSTILTVYTGMITFFNIISKIKPSILDYLILVIPVIAWIVSISWNVYVYFPGKYEFKENSPTEIKNTLETIIGKKYKRLKIGAAGFIFAISCTSIVMIYLLFQITKMQ
jgi:hypothetical protein